MRIKLFSCMVLATVICFAAFISLEAEANTYDEKQLEEFVKGNNYMPVREAIDLYEKKLEKRVMLPTTLPFEPTHRFGKLTDNGDLQIHYMNIEDDHQDFIFYIMYPDSELDEHITTEDKIITLNDSNKAYFRENSSHLRSLAFKKNGFGYLIGGNPKQNNKYSVKGLTEIANSIE